MSDDTVRKIWGPEDFAETMRAAAQHRAEPGVEAVVTKATENEIVIEYRPEPTNPAEVYPAEAMEPDVLYAAVAEDRPLPFRRNPAAACPSCWSHAFEPCGAYCLSRLEPEEQIAHRDAVLEGALAEIERLEEPYTRYWHGEPVKVTTCTVGGRHVDEWSKDWRRPKPRRRARAIVAGLVALLVIIVGALWLAAPAKADHDFTLCPSGLTGVQTADTSCAFAENVRASFYWNPGWTIVTTSPVTGKFYTMQCHRTDTTGTGWLDSKRCYGLSDGGDPLIVFIA